MNAQTSELEALILAQWPACFEDLIRDAGAVEFIPINFEKSMKTNLDKPPEPYTPVPKQVRVLYRNHAGAAAWRTVLPVTLWFGTSSWHPGEQWLLGVVDRDKQAARDFALKDILCWEAPSRPLSLGQMEEAEHLARLREFESLREQYHTNVVVQQCVRHYAHGGFATKEEALVKMVKLLAEQNANLLRSPLGLDPTIASIEKKVE